MSDYGDDYSDYGEEWMYVEDEYMAADDLAEHAVASPPPTYADNDDAADWDRFDYFNDIEYGSDGFDDTATVAHDVKDAKAGQKRKRAPEQTRSNKRRSMGNSDTKSDASRLDHSPIIWRSQEEREPAVAVLDDNAPSYSLLKDWREKLADTPQWTPASPLARPAKSPSARPPRPGKGKGKVTFAPAPVSPPYNEGDAEEEEDADMNAEDDEEGEGAITQEALMAALQRQLASAGGPLAGMEPQQLLAFAMRMASDKDAGDDIAGEMADAMLDGDDGDDDEDTEENLFSWVAQQRNANKDGTEEGLESPVAASSERPPTPPSSEANRSVCVKATSTRTVQKGAKGALKRKVEDVEEDEGATKVAKKRVTRSFDAPMAASQARATAPAKATRSTRAKKS